MTHEHRDPYVVLGIGRYASASDVARAYRRAARATHPDSSSGGASSAERFQTVTDAYEMLRDPQRRAAYDRAYPAVHRSGAPAAPSARQGTVRYGSPDGRHIVLGAPAPAPVPLAEVLVALLWSGS